MLVMRICGHSGNERVALLLIHSLPHPLHIESGNILPISQG